MTTLQANIEALAGLYPIPSEDKLQRRLKRLMALKIYYETLLSDADDTEHYDLSSKVAAINYSITTIKLYRKVTTGLQGLAKGQE